MKKILIYGIGKNLGGIEIFVLNLVEKIDKNKYNISILKTTRKDVCFEDEFRKNGCRFFYVTPRSESITKHIKELRYLFKKEKFDIVHCNYVFLNNVSIIRLARKSGAKVLLHAHNANYPNNIKFCILHIINYLTLPMHGTKYLAVSDLAGKFMFGSKKYSVVNNGVDIEKFKYSLEKRKEFRKNMGIANSTDVWVHVGRFAYEKNHNFLISVFYEYMNIKNTNQDSLLILVGSGSFENEIKCKIKQLGIEKNVLLLGNRRDVDHILSGGDFFIFPSFSEGFSIAFVEAEVSGLACVCSEGIPNQAIFDSRVTKISLKKSAREWAETILDIDKNLNRNIDKELIDCFSIEKTVNQIEHIYDIL